MPQFTRREFIKTTILALMGLAISPIKIKLDEKSEIDKSKFSILLDPGHGGIDPGATNNDVHEASIVYDISVRLKTKLESEGYNIHQSRYNLLHKYSPLETLINSEKDVLVVKDNKKIKLDRRRLTQRAEILNNTFKEEDPLLISLHVDSARPIISGVIIYYPSSIYPPPEAHNKSYNFAKTINYQFRQEGIEGYNLSLFKFFKQSLPTESDNFKRGDNFRLTIFEKTPNIKEKILIECGNINNSKELKLLTSPQYRDKIATSIAKGINTYLELTRS